MSQREAAEAMPERPTGATEQSNWRESIRLWPFTRHHPPMDSRRYFICWCCGKVADRDGAESYGKPHGGSTKYVPVCAECGKEWWLLGELL